MTSDATAAAKFYGAVVDWKSADRSDPSGGDTDYRMIGRSDGGYNDGGRQLMPRKDLPVGAIAMVTDPMGTPFYLMAPSPPPGKLDAKSDVLDVTAAQHVRWNELASPDQRRAKQFYAKHFGFEFKDSMPIGMMGSYDLIDHAGLRLGAIMQKPPQSANGAWLFYFGVQSIAAAKAAVEIGGGTVVNGPASGAGRRLGTHRR